MNGKVVRLVVFSCLAVSLTSACDNLAYSVGSNCGAQYVSNVAPSLALDSRISCGAYSGDLSAYPAGISTPVSVATGPVNYASGPIYSQPIAYPSSVNLPGSIECGPNASPLRVKTLPPVVLPPVNERIQELATPPLPPPTVISNRCVCTKVVQKPQLYQRIIQVQKNQRFLKKTIVPRVEKVSYCAKPRC